MRSPTLDDNSRREIEMMMNDVMSFSYSLSKHVKSFQKKTGKCGFFQTPSFSTSETSERNQGNQGNSLKNPVVLWCSEAMASSIDPYWKRRVSDGRVDPCKGL